MVPNVDLLVSAALRAMKEVVAPAIPQEQGVAAEQARVVIGVLSLLRKRVSFESVRSLKELEIAVDLAEQVTGVLSNPGALKAELEAARQNSSDAMNDKKRDAVKRSLLACVATSIDDEHDREAKNRLLRAVLEISAKQTSLARAWSMPSGFEPASSDVDPLIALTERG